MRSDQYVDLAREQAFGEFRALLLLRRAGQQADAQADPLGHPHDRRIMLRRENLRRSHQAGLKAVVASQQHAHQCDERLAAAHVALQQAVHLMPGHGVLTDFADHALLRPGQRKRQSLVIKRIEKPAHGREQESVLARGAGMSLLQNIELDAEQLVELETQLGVAQRLLRSRKMDIIERVAQRNETVLADHLVGQGFAQPSVDLRPQIAHQRMNRLRTQLRVAQLFGRAVHALHGRVESIFLIEHRLDLGMH